MSPPPTPSSETHDLVTLPRTRVVPMRSRHADADYQIRIAEPVPGAFPQPPQDPVALYLLDADLFFGTAVEMTRLMHQLYGELPPILVVGVGYGVTDPALQAELRGRDFTPTADSGFGEMARSLPGAPPPTLPEDRRLGRASHFLDFLTGEVRPWVEDRYEVRPGSSILFGSSLGGLFALYSLLQRPGSFDAYIATSPAIWWDDDLLLRMEEERVGHDLPGRLVLAVGELEEHPAIPMLASFKMVTNVRRMAERLSDRGHSLEVQSFVLNGESHTSVVPVSLTRGLRALLGRRPPG